MLQYYKHIILKTEKKFYINTEQKHIFFNTYQKHILNRAETFIYSKQSKTYAPLQRKHTLIQIKHSPKYRTNINSSSEQNIYSIKSNHILNRAETFIYSNTQQTYAPLQRKHIL